MESGEYVWAILETNRGCPFKCTYCYWGGATNSKVHKYSEGRIFDEITWCSENGALYVYIADANFGMLKRDVEIAKHLAACKRKTGLPLAVQFSSSKNTPERVSEIALIFADANLVSTQPISLQTMNENTLVAIKRENIRTESYTRLQGVLNDRNVSSFIEIIWPLPGETLESFKEGISTLCDAGADSYHFYPLMIIGNVEMETQADEFGLVTVEDPNVNSEARLVIETKHVTRAQYLDGVRFTYHVTSLYVLRGLWYVLKYLRAEKSFSYASVFSQFADYCAARADNPYVRVIEETLRTFGHYRYTAEGAIMYSVLHANRAVFDTLLVEFVRSRGWLDDVQVKIRLELDLLNRPYVFSNTPIQRQNLQLLSVVWTNGKKRLVRIPPAHRRLVGALLGLGELEDGYVTVDYSKSQMPFMQGKSLDDNLSYCQDRLLKMKALLPTWSVATSLSAAGPTATATG
jgi:putative methyltransferase